MPWQRLLRFLAGYLDSMFDPVRKVTDLHKYSAWAIGYFTAGNFNLHYYLNLWTDSFANWITTLVMLIWGYYVKPFITDVFAVELRVAAMFNYVVGPLASGIVSMVVWVRDGVLGALNYVPAVLDAVRVALLGARGAVMPWVVGLEDFLYSRYQLAYTGFEGARGKLNSLVPWLNYAFVADGTLRGAVLLTSLQSYAEEFLNVLTNSGLDQVLLDGYEQLPVVHPTRPVNQAPAKILEWSESPPDFIQEAIARIAAGLQ